MTRKNWFIDVQKELSHHLKDRRKVHFFVETGNKDLDKFLGFEQLTHTPDLKEPGSELAKILFSAIYLAQLILADEKQIKDLNLDDIEEKVALSKIKNGVSQYIETQSLEYLAQLISADEKGIKNLNLDSREKAALANIKNKYSEYTKSESLIERMEISKGIRTASLSLQKVFGKIWVTKILEKIKLDIDYHINRCTFYIAEHRSAIGSKLKIFCYSLLNLELITDQRFPQLFCFEQLDHSSLGNFLKIFFIQLELEIIVDSLDKEADYLSLYHFQKLFNLIKSYQSTEEADLYQIAFNSWKTSFTSLKLVEISTVPTEIEEFCNEFKGVKFQPLALQLNRIFINQHQPLEKAVLHAIHRKYMKILFLKEEFCSREDSVIHSGSSSAFIPRPASSTKWPQSISGRTQIREETLSAIY